MSNATVTGAREGRVVATVEGVYENVPGSGIWYVRYRVNGRLVRKSIGKKKDAVSYHRKIKTLMEQGEGFVPLTAKQHGRTDTEIAKARTGIVLVSELCDDLLNAIQGDPVKYKDQKNPPARIAAIRKAFGERPAATVRASDVKAWLNSLAVKPNKRTGRVNKPATLNRMKAMLSAVYQEGKENDKVLVNPARDLKQRAVGKGVVRFLSPDEENRLRAVLLGHLETKAHLAQYQEPWVKHRIAELDIALGTGMRKSEQYGMKWEDVDFERGELTLHDTKNGDSRLVMMIDDVAAALKVLQGLSLIRKAGRKQPTPEDTVFALTDNKKWWTAALEEAKIYDFRWHDLRHTFCSRLAQNGASLKIIQEAAGHKTIAMAARYAHLDQTSLRNAMAILNRPKGE